MAAPVVETILKRRKDSREASMQRKAAAQAQRKSGASRTQFRSAEHFLRRAEGRSKSEVIYTRAAKQLARTAGLPANTSAPVAVAVYVRPRYELAPAVREAMASLGLLKVNDLVFVRLNETNRGVLALADQAVAWGEPTAALVQAVIYKRATLPREDGTRSMITDNNIVEAVLGDEGIICVEDLVHEIVTAGQGFEAVARAMGATRLAPPAHAADGKRWNLVDDTGNGYGGRGYVAEKINDYVSRAL